MSTSSRTKNSFVSMPSAASCGSAAFITRVRRRWLSFHNWAESSSAIGTSSRWYGSELVPNRTSAFCEQPYREGERPVIRHLSVPRETFELAADLYLPDDADGPLPAIVLTTPGSSVKQQIGANYASRLARHGFAALTFDPAHQEQSGGEPRDLEDPYRRGEDISYA